jgi:hypothetical protein
MRAIAIAAGALTLLFATGASPDEMHVTELLASIKGQENRPAGEVFKNVKLLKNVPAGRFLKLMDQSYSRALGVDCDHCHVEDRWDADEKRPKRAAREMIVMVNQINDILSQMQDIDTTDSDITCTTCHRGYVKPATQMK